MKEIFRGNISINHVVNSPGKSCAFGVIMKDDPVTAFFPFWVVNAFEITMDDKGFLFDCLYVDREEDKNPCVIAIIEEGDMKEPEIVGNYVGTPGSEAFTMYINKLNKDRS